MFMRLFFVALLASIYTLPVEAQGRRGDQDEAYQARSLGALRPLREIESGIVPDMKRRGADYIGARRLGHLDRRRRAQRHGRRARGRLIGVHARNREIPTCGC